MGETKWEKWQVIGASPRAHKISNCIITSEKAKILHIFVFREMTILGSLASILIEGLNVAILKPFSILAESGEKFCEIVPKVGKDRNLEIRQVCFALHGVEIKKQFGRLKPPPIKTALAR